MLRISLMGVVLLGLVATGVSQAATYYVATSGNDAAAGTNWVTAKQTIQAAVNLTVDGDSVLVSNGVYATGGTVVFGAMTNRVAITNAITVSSVNGASATTISGSGPLVDAAVRCVYLGANAVLSGFTLTNGYTRSAGDNIKERSGGGVFCESSAIVSNCLITGCSAANIGGGGYAGTFSLCTFYGNSSSSSGGGAGAATLKNCLVAGNTALAGGGTFSGTMYGCTVAGNSATLTQGGGGTSFGTAYNSIVYSNSAPASNNYANTTFFNSCTTPLPGGGGNISNAPLFVATNNFHLRFGSPCIDAGNNLYAHGATDLDGKSRTLNGTADMGAYEYAPSTYYVATSGNDAAAGTSWVTAKLTIQSAIDLASDNDTVLVSNGVYASGTLPTPGYTTSNRVVISNVITVASVNGPSVTTIMGTRNLTNEALSARCVYMSAGTLSGFTLTNGFAQAVTGANLEQNRSGGGAYMAGGIISNCVITDNMATNGSGGGVINGTLYNCTLTRNLAYDSGGAHFANLNNCMLSGNQARNLGGAAGGGVLNNCLLVSNSAVFIGGAVAGSTLNNCTLSANTSSNVGGAYLGSLNNCIVYFNRDTNGFANYSSATFNYSCTTPTPAGGAGNITNQPLFAATNNYRLATNSPCRDTGANGFAPSTPELDGNARIINGTVDMGAYESLPALTLTVTGGTGTGGGFHAPGSNVVLSATRQDRHWFFTQWNDGETNRTRIIVMPLTNITYTAAFTQAPVGAITWYVATNGDDTAVGTSWATAKQTIQAGVDETLDGDTVLVGDGTYSNGVTVTPGRLASNRVVITNNITVQSANGPGTTVILGTSFPLTLTSAVRCVYISQGLLSGFTLSRGGTLTNGDSIYDQSGAGAWADGGTLSNCMINFCNSGNHGGGSYGGTLVDCSLSNNVAGSSGGGALASTLYNCTLIYNYAYDSGGGSSGGTLSNCTLRENTAVDFGGGANASTLFNCLLEGNFAALGGGGGSQGGVLIGCTLSNNAAGYNGYISRGGGSYGGTLINSVLVGNQALDFTFGSYGGGSYDSRLYNCLVTRNSAENGGGVVSSFLTMRNCTIWGNTASSFGGGVIGSTLYNCIVYSNSAPNSPNYSTNDIGHLNYSCTTPLPTNGTNNISGEPQFVNTATYDFRLRSSSPCIDAGNNSHATNVTDLAGNPRIIHGIVDMGAYEFQGYWAWAAAITNGETNETDSATGDDYLNLLKYATGSNPTNADELASLAAAFTNGLFAALFNRNTNATDVTILLERGDSLTNDAPWTAIATNVQGYWSGATNVIETSGTNPVAVTVIDSGIDTNIFHRLRVTLP